MAVRQNQDLMAIAVLYEHPEWFKPLFATLDRRGLPWVPVDAASLAWDPTVRPEFDLLVNRMSPSAWTRGHGHAIQSTLAYLHYVERWGIPVSTGWIPGVSKSRSPRSWTCSSGWACPIPAHGSSTTRRRRRRRPVACGSRLW